MSLRSAESHAQSASQSWKVDAFYGNFGGISARNLPNDDVFFLKLSLTHGYTLLFHNGAALSLRVLARNFNGLNTPADYDQGTSWNLFGGSGNPIEDAAAFSLSAGYKWHPARTPLLRIGAEAGPALVNYNRVRFTPQPVTVARSGGFFGPDSSANYSYTRRHENHTGAAVALRIEAPLSRFVGLEFGVWKVFNSAVPLAGTETSLTFGLVRRRIDLEDAGRL